MYTHWTKGMEEQEAKEWLFNASLSKKVLTKIKERLVSSLNYSESEMRSKDNYDSASWPYLQASLLGEQRAYGKAVDLINNIIEGSNS